MALHIEEHHEIHEDQCAYPWCAFYHVTLGYPGSTDRWPCPQHPRITGKSDQTSLLEAVLHLLRRDLRRRTSEGV